MSTGTNKPSVIDGIPEAERVHELMKSYPKVSARVQRRNDRGQLATVLAQQVIDTEALLDFDSWLLEQAGGGDYLVYVRPPGDLSHILMRFTCRVEGAPRQPAVRMGRPVSPGMPLDNSVETSPNASWAGGIMDPIKRAEYLGQLPPGATLASDQLAMQQLAETKSALAKLEERYAQESKEAARLRSEMEKRLEEQRREAQEAKHRSELELVRATMASQQAETKAMLTAMRETKPEPVDRTAQIQAFTAIAAAIAPVIATFISASKESSSKALEVQQNGLATLMNATLAQANRPDPTMEMFKTMGPMLIPLLQGLMDQKSPATQAALFNTVAENQLNSVAMMAQLIESFSGGDKDEPWWLPMVRETLQGAVQVGQAMMEANQQTQQQQSQPRLPQSQPAFPQATGQAPVMRDEEPAVRAVSPAQTNESKTALGGIMAMLPERFRTPEWRLILTNMHDETMPVGDVAEMLAEHIAHCIRFDVLPEQLEGVLESPEEVLGEVLSVLPLARKSPERGQEIIAQTIVVWTEAGMLDPEDDTLDVEGEVVADNAAE